MKLRYLAIGLLLAASACNTGGAGKNGGAASAVEEQPLKPAQPAGTMAVTIIGREKDTSAVTFHFSIDTIRYERTYKDVPLAKGVPDSAVYRVFWDEPNSVWIGFIKPNRDTRYYHASQDGRLLKVLWVPSPPKRIYEYMEKTMGLGNAIRQQPTVTQYAKYVQSGTLLDTLKVELRNTRNPLITNIYMKFGGVERNLEMQVPERAKAYIQPFTDDHVVVGFDFMGEKEEMCEIKVVNGRIGYKTLQKLIN